MSRQTHKTTETPALHARGSAKRRGLDPSSQLIISECMRRGIAVEMLDERAAYFRMIYKDRSLTCWESLSELTSAVALSRCDDKRLTARLLKSMGLSIPEQVEVGTLEENASFLEKHGSIVVKPARGEQGRGVSVGIRTLEALDAAIQMAAEYGSSVVLEQVVRGDDLRLVVIDYKLVAASVRRPPSVTGNGKQSALELIEEESQRRSAATAGESRIPVDLETRRCVRDAGYELDDVLPSGLKIVVRHAANLHLGGTMTDVTAELHPLLLAAAERAARALEIPVVGLDFIVPSVRGADYWIIEANERPGLANHEPQPTAQCFVDFLFPETV